MTIRTKIICTIGPACNSYEKILDLIRAGMNVARLNFSHGTYEQHLSAIKFLKQARQELKMPLAIMLDTRGPEVRIGKLENDEISLQKGDKWLLVKDEILGNSQKVTLTPGYVLDRLPKDTRILFDDGYISSQVVEHTKDGVLVEIDNGGSLKSRKGVNIPNVRLDLPAITQRDIEDIKFGCEHGIDIIAASFVRSAENIITVKNILAEIGSESVQVVAKIENYEGIANFDSILQVADGVMIARGDLGVEVPLSQVPRLQKEMIRKCYLAGKPSVTATQMLESMIHNPRPTRAEVSDVANAIYDSTSSVMLSGETAVGKYPVQTILVMKSIIREAEADFDYRSFFDVHSTFIYNDVPSSVTLATVKTAYSSNAKAIFAFTSSGGTARLLSRLRPKMQIISMTSNEKTYHQMSFNWGIIPVLEPKPNNLEDAFKKISEFALDKKLVSYGDLVIVIAGSTFGISGTTNMMIVENIGDVLVRGHSGTGERIYGNVKILLSPDESVEPYSVRGQLLVISYCDKSFLPFMHEAGGIILQNHIDDNMSEQFLLENARQMGKPAIVRADAAVNILKDGQLVTLDPAKSLVYKGVVLT
jgi:pyruvate kinase